MDDLNNQQLVLLCIFVSFVVSIATGITTVAFLTDPSSTISETINRVVERTVETVSPTEETPETPSTPVATESDQIANAVEKAQKYIVSVKNGLGELESRAIVIDERTVISGLLPAGTYQIEKNGKLLSATVESSNEYFSTLKTQDSIQTDSFATFSDAVKVGQIAVNVYIDPTLTVEQGIVNSTTPVTGGMIVVTSITGPPEGSVIVGVDGNVLGLWSVTASVPGFYKNVAVEP